jgi:hypothetical protein
MKRTSRFAIAVMAVATWGLVAACAGAGPRLAEPPARPAPALTLDASQAALAPPGPSLGGQRSGGLLVWLSSQPGQPMQGTAVMDAYLADLTGQAITDARVTFDTDMTNMSHGLYLVTAQPVGSGHYAGRVHFSMPGPWRVIAIIERPGEEVVRLRFEFRVNAS